MRPQVGCLGAFALLDIWRYSQKRRVLGMSTGPFLPLLVHECSQTVYYSVAVSSLLPGPWVWGERDSTVQHRYNPKATQMIGRRSGE